MKKIVRLTESDLVRLVKRVINEQVIKSMSDLKSQQTYSDYYGGKISSTNTKQELKKTGEGYYEKNIWPDKSQMQRDVLDPYKVTPDLSMRKQVMEQFYKKYGRYPTDDDFKNVDPSKYEYKDLLDWISWTIKWFGPQGKLASKVIEVAQGLIFMYLSNQSKTMFDEVINFINGISYFLKAGDISIPIPSSINDFIKRVINYLENNKKVGFLFKKVAGLTETANEIYNNMSRFKQIVVCVLVKYFGSTIEKTIDIIINYFLVPLNDLLGYFNPTLSSYGNSCIEVLKSIKGSISTAKILIVDIDKANIIGGIK
jgi:hypothetical protein